MLRKFSKSVLIVLLALAMPLFVIADDSFADFESHLRRTYRIADSMSIKEATLLRIADAESALEDFPENHRFRRDLGDAYHTMSHILEHEGDFVLSAVYSTKSISYFMNNPIESRESYDGYLHAMEHVFMDFHDRAVVLEKAGRIQAAEKQYILALEYVRNKKILQTNVSYSDRFVPRYITVLKMSRKLGAQLTPLEIKYEKMICDLSLSAPPH